MKLILITILLLFFVVNTVNAQHDHSSHDHNASSEHSHKTEPPHGGIMKDAGKYHFEIVADFAAMNEKLSIYVLKANLKPVLSSQVNGKAKIIYIDGKEETFALISDTSEKLYCNPTDMTKGFNAIITITIKGKEYSTTYTHKGLQK